MMFEYWPTFVKGKCQPLNFLPSCFDWKLKKLDGKLWPATADKSILTGPGTQSGYIVPPGRLIPPSTLIMLDVLCSAGWLNQKHLRVYYLQMRLANMLILVAWRHCTLSIIIASLHLFSELKVQKIDINMDNVEGLIKGKGTCNIFIHTYIQAILLFWAFYSKTHPGWYPRGISSYHDLKLKEGFQLLSSTSPFSNTYCI